MTCLSPVTIKGMTYRCGHCSECLKIERLMWTIRMDAEMKMHDKNCFLTLTYDDDHLPADQCVSKARMRKLWKDFRNKWKIRYFCAAEYGSEKGRPHYHVAAFGIDHKSPCFSGLRYDQKNHVWRGKMAFWPDGDVAVGNLTSRSIQYIGKYILKKLGHDQVREDGRTKEFRTMSLRPGLGFDFLQKHADEIRARGTYILDGQELPLPRYFIDKVLSDDDKERLRMPMIEASARKWDEFVASGNMQVFERPDLDQVALNAAAKARLFGSKGGKVDFTQNKNSSQDDSLFMLGGATGH